MPVARLDENTFGWNGLKDERIQCQWVLFEKKEIDDTTVYTVTKLQRPAGYDLNIPDQR